MSTVHDIMAILELIPKGTPTEAAAMLLIRNYEASGIRIMEAGPATANAVHLLGQLRENLLHELCQLVDPVHGLVLPVPAPGSLSPLI